MLGHNDLALSVSLTFHKPSPLPRLPSVPHVYIMKREREKKKKVCVSVSVDVRLSFSSLPECPHAYVGAPVVISVKGDDFFFNDGISSDSSEKQFLLYSLQIMSLHYS